MPNHTIELTDEQERFIRARIDAGRYLSASEVLRAGLRLLEQKEDEDRLKLEVLRRMAEQSMASIRAGEYEEVDPDSLDAFMSKIKANVQSSENP